MCRVGVGSCHDGGMELPGVGVDIETVSRFAQVRPGLFSESELQHAGDSAESRAGIWCAKEAVVKAVSKWRLLSVRQVEITHHEGRPAAVVAGFHVDVSISHTRDYAVGFAIAIPASEVGIGGS